MAHHLAFKTQMTVEAASALLACGERFPASTSATKGPRLTIINPKLSPFGDAGGGGIEPSADKSWDAVITMLNDELKPR